jgi:hypothetical protein
MFKKNEFKFSALRQFGSENISFTATLHSGKITLSDREIQSQVDQVSTLIHKAFVAAQEREFSEKELLVNASDRRRAGVEKLDAALKEEMDAKKHADQTVRDAERLSNQITKNSHGKQ